jgi:glycosyltransferase involved in cell wall biosynthesis
VRVVVCDDGLTDRVGHFFNLAVALREELTARDVEYAIFGNAALAPELAQQLDARAVFRRGTNDGFGRGGPPNELLAYTRTLRSFASGLDAVRPGPDDLLFLPMARAAEIAGIARWLRRGGTAPVAVCANFMIDDFDFRPPRLSPSVLPALYRVAFGSLSRRLAPGRLILTAADEELASAAGRATGAHVRVYPMLKRYPPRAAPAPTAAATVAFLGDVRRNKGGALLDVLVERLAQTMPTARFVVQGLAAAPALPNVEALPVGLDRGAYYELLRRADVVVQPYEAAPYRRMSSGIFAEAVAFGCATVVPAGTWMARMVAEGRGAGLTFDRLEPDIVATAVRAVVADLPGFRALAEAAATPWRASQNVGAYLDRLAEDLVPAGGLRPRGIS